MKTNRTTVLSMLERSSDLPTLPAVMNRLISAVNAANTNAEQVAKIIHDDPAMMARLLKLVNSAAYSTGTEKIISVQQAVTRLGFATVKNLAMTTSVFGAYTSDEEADFSRQEFWRHSICVGIATYVVFQKTKNGDTPLFQKDQLHLCGLLHDIGKILLEKYFHKEFMEAVRCAREENIPLIVAEQRIYETDHTEIGAWLAKKWNMSEEIVETIRKHHHPETADEKWLHLVRLCHTANHICNLENLGDGGDTAISHFHIEVWKRLGLKVKDIENIVAEVNEQSKESETLMAFVS